MHGWAFDSSCPSSLMWPPFSKISATKVAATGPNDKVNFSYLFFRQSKVENTVLVLCVSQFDDFFEFVYFFEICAPISSWTMRNELSSKNQNKSWKINSIFVCFTAKWSSNEEISKYGSKTSTDKSGKPVWNPAVGENDKKDYKPVNFDGKSLQRDSAPDTKQFQQVRHSRFISLHKEFVNDFVNEPLSWYLKMISGYFKHMKSSGLIQSFESNPIF